MILSRNRDEDLRIIATALLESASHSDMSNYFIDLKRPLGNSQIDIDVLELLGIEPSMQTREGAFYTPTEKEYAWSLFKDIPKWIYKTWLNHVPVKP